MGLIRFITGIPIAEGHNSLTEASEVRKSPRQVTQQLAKPTEAGDKNFCTQKPFCPLFSAQFSGSVAPR